MSIFEFSRAFSVLSAQAVTSQTSLILIPIEKQATNMLDLFAFCFKKKAWTMDKNILHNKVQWPKKKIMNTPMEFGYKIYVAKSTNDKSILKIWHFTDRKCFAVRNIVLLQNRGQKDDEAISIWQILPKRVSFNLQNYVLNTSLSFIRI